MNSIISLPEGPKGVNGEPSRPIDYNLLLPNYPQALARFIHNHSVLKSLILGEIETQVDKFILTYLHQ